MATSGCALHDDSLHLNSLCLPLIPTAKPEEKGTVLTVPSPLANSKLIPRQSRRRNVSSLNPFTLPHGVARRRPRVSDVLRSSPSLARIWYRSFAVLTRLVSP